MAAVDGLNDEGWNPAFLGAPFVAIALPVGSYFALARTGRTAIIFVTSIVAALAVLPIATVGGQIIEALSSRGWPVTW